MAHVCSECTKRFHPHCPVCDVLYSGINTMREQMYWERICWDLGLAPAELEYEFDYLATTIDPSRVPRLVVVPDWPASDTFENDFAEYFNEDAMDTDSAMKESTQVVNNGFDTQSSQYPAHRQYWHIVQAPTKGVAFPAPGDKSDVYIVYRVRTLPPITGYGRMSITEGAEASELFEQRMAILSRGVENIEFADYHDRREKPSVFPTATISTAAERVPYPNHQSRRAVEQAPLASSSIIGFAAQTINTTLSASHMHVRFAVDNESDEKQDTNNALATRSNACLQSTAAHKSDVDQHNYIATFCCMYCGCDSGRSRQSDAPRRHRIGDGFAKCAIAKVVGHTSGARNANFLLARWPQLLERKFADDHLKGKLQAMCIDYAAKVEAGEASWTTLVQERLDAFAAHRMVPGPNAGFFDREILAIDT